MLDGVGQIQITELLDEDRELPVTLTLVAGLIKGERWDWLLQKCTELGLSLIHIFLFLYPKSEEIKN